MVRQHATALARGSLEVTEDASGAPQAGFAEAPALVREHEETVGRPRPFFGEVYDKMSDPGETAVANLRVLATNGYATMRDLGETAVANLATNGRATMRDLGERAAANL